ARRAAGSAMLTASRGWSSARVHIELTEMLRCPERHEEGYLVMSTGEMVGRMVRSGMLGCPACGKEYPILRGVAHLEGSRERGAGPSVGPSGPAPRSPLPVDAQTLQALLDLSGPGGYVLLLGSATRPAGGPPGWV